MPRKRENKYQVDMKGPAGWLRELFLVYAEVAKVLPWEIVSQVRQLDYAGGPWLAFNDALWASRIPDYTYGSTLGGVIRLWAFAGSQVFKIGRERSPVLYIRGPRHSPLSETALSNYVENIQKFNSQFDRNMAGFIDELDVYRPGDRVPFGVEKEDLPVVRVWWD